MQVIIPGPEAFQQLFSLANPKLSHETLLDTSFVLPNAWRTNEEGELRPNDITRVFSSVANTLRPKEIMARYGRALLASYNDTFNSGISITTSPLVLEEIKDMPKVIREYVSPLTRRIKGSYQDFCLRLASSFESCVLSLAKAIEIDETQKHDLVSRLDPIVRTGWENKFGAKIEAVRQKSMPVKERDESEAIRLAKHYLVNHTNPQTSYLAQQALKLLIRQKKLEALYRYMERADIDLMATSIQTGFPIRTSDFRMMATGRIMNNKGYRPELKVEAVMTDRAKTGFDIVKSYAPTEHYPNSSVIMNY